MQTLARWIRTILQLAGIDLSIYKPHSTRHAAATAAFNANLPLNEILSKAGWSNARTFERFYYKPIVQSK